MSLISQIVTDVCAQANTLDEVRLRLFLDWLRAHHRTEETIHTRNLPLYLQTWLDGLTPDGVQWEYQVLLGEVTWWRNLSVERLLRMIQMERS